MSQLRLSLISLLFFTCPAPGSPIISVNGPLDGGSYGISTSQAVASSWSQSQTYTNVEISALLTSGAGTGTAYLMTGIGPGTTTAHEIRSENFTFPLTAERVTLFADLTLKPGTYYLVLGSAASQEGQGGWRDAYDCGTSCSFPVPTITMETGAKRYSDYLAPAGAVNDYAPASAFQQNMGIRGDPLLQFTVASDLETIASVPEPSNLNLVFALILSAILFRLRSSRPRLRSAIRPQEAYSGNAVGGGPDG